MALKKAGGFINIVNKGVNTHLLRQCRKNLNFAFLTACRCLASHLFLPSLTACRKTQYGAFNGIPSNLKLIEDLKISSGFSKFGKIRVNKTCQ